MQRQQEGIAIAKKQGKYKGRKPIERPNFDAVVKQWQEGKISAAEAMKMLRMTKTTFYRKAKKPR